MSYTISDVKTKPVNDVTKLSYSEVEEYYTQDSSDNSYSWESEYKIKERNSKIPSELLDEWVEAVMKYIDDYNSKLQGLSVKFEILNVRTNAMYNYKKYLNGTLTDEGWADYGMINEDDMEAWVEAVMKFRKENNLGLPLDAALGSISELKAKISIPTSPFDSDFGEIPTIPSALQMLTSDPCKFPAKIVEAVKTGTLSLIDTVKHKINSVKEEVKETIKKVTDDFNISVKPMLTPVISAVASQITGMGDEIQIAQEYYRKKFASEIDNMTALMEQEESDDTSDSSTESEEEEEAVLVTSDAKYEIPSWMTENIKTAMNGRFKGGIPSKEVIDRYNEHKSYFTSTFKKYGVPEQLTVLSIIESNVKNISTENSETAKGMWQFVRLTAQQYGLLKLALKPGLSENYNKYSSKNYNIVSDYDKRNQMEPSTEAAAKLLRDIRKTRKKINNWLLVAAGYNWGGGNVSSAITKAGNGANVWDVWQRLPLETKNYVCLTIGLCNYLGMSTDPLFE